jgi:hypothetical protein
MYMKKIILVLAVLVFAVPTLAAITVTAVPVQVQIKDYNGNNIWVDTDEVAINWVSDPNVESRARAFALDITTSKKAGDTGADPNIESVGSFNSNYYIYPGSIVINDVNGAVTSWGTPIAAGGAGTTAMTIEMGSLYATNDIQIPARRNPPPASGTLLKFKVKDNCHVQVRPNALRGGVVRENGQPGSTFVDANSNMYTRDDLATWRTVGRPKCWAHGIVPRQCHGDADGRSQSKSYYVYSWDTEVFRAAYGLALPYAVPTIVTGGGDTVKKICADFDHLSQSKSYRVYSNDTAIFRAGYGIQNKPDPNCL